MPNWCTTSVAFKGKPENINKLREDVQKATDWYYENSFFTSMRYFLSLSNFDTVSYVQRYRDYYSAPNFRGSIYDSSFKCVECEDGELKYFATLEMAWNTDYEVLILISKLYDVKFSAYSEEFGMGIFTRCSNGLVDDYDYNFIIKPDYEQLEEFQEENNYKLDIDYYNPVKNCSEDVNEIIDTLRMHNIDFGIEPIERFYSPQLRIYGIYQHYIYGVDYDEKESWNQSYPGLDRFNKYYTPGIIYDTEE